MAVYDLEEQDQIDDLKAWWARYGGAITVGLVLGRARDRRRAGLALVERQARRGRVGALLGGERGGAREGAAEGEGRDAQITDKYAGTGYAPRAALLYAKMLYDSGDRDGAKAQYAWAVEHAKEDELQAIARYRLAQVQVDEKQYDAALARSTRSMRTRSTACSPTCAAMRWPPPGAPPTRAPRIKRRSRSSIPSRRTASTCRS